MSHLPHCSAKRPRIDDPATVSLPPEIWEHVFRFVPSGFQLLRLRLVCRCWNDVISGSPSLMDRFCFHIIGQGRQGARMDRDYVPPGLNPKVTRLILRRFHIDGVGTWFRDAAPKLTEMKLADCNLTVEVLFEMLRLMPNLKRLVLNQLRLTGSGELDFCMNQVRSLKIDNVCYGTDDGRNLMDGFVHMFPRLRELSLGKGFEFNKKEILDWVRQMQSSLRQLELCRYPFLVGGLCLLKELRLEQVSLNPNFPQDLDSWASFCRAQPHLEILTLQTDYAEVLVETGHLLPKLRKLSLRLDGGRLQEVSFLRAMPRLEFLEISESKLLFYYHSCPNLEQLVLKKVETDDLSQFLNRSPKLTRLHLINCDLKCLDVSPGSLPSLKILMLDGASYTYRRANFPTDMPREPTGPFISCCPNLEELHLLRHDFLVENVVYEFCKKLKHLKKLSLISNRYVTDKSAGLITRHCHALEELYADFSGSVLDEIEATRRNLLVKRHVR